MAISDKQYASLPKRPFLYTLDQIAGILAMPTNNDVRRYIHFKGVSRMRITNRELIAHNIAPPHLNPDWRVSEDELIRWLKAVGFRVHSNGRLF